MISPTVMVPALLTLALKASLLLGAAFVITALLRRASAASRHVVWLAAFVGVLVLPVAGLLLPALRISVPEPLASWAGVSEVPAAGFGYTLAVPTPVDESVLVPKVPAPATAADVRYRYPTVVAVEVPHAHAVAPHEEVIVYDRSAVAPSAWPTRLFLLWLFGFVMVAVAFAVGVLRTHIVACTALPASGDAMSDEVEVLSAELGIVRDVKLVTWAGPAMPMTWGALRPVVLLPEDARLWPAARRRDVLTHELAHVRRGDWMARLIAALACAIYWFNPLAWLAARWMRNEQELACDDTVLAGGVQPSAYATHLLEVARALRVPSFAMANASVAMARPSQLTGRLLAVLDESRARACSAPRLTVGMCAVLGVLLVATVGAAAPMAAGQSDVPALAEPAEPAHPAEPAPVAVFAVPGEYKVAVAPGTAVYSFAASECWSSTPSADGRAGAGRGQGSTSVSQSRGRGRSGVSRSHSSSTHDDGTNELTTLTLSHGSGCELELRMSGRVRFNDTETDVIEVANGASFRLLEDADGVERRLDVSWRGGQLVRRWRVDGDDVAETEELRGWLARTLQVALTQTGYNVVPRTMRAYRAGGLDSVLALTDNIGSDYSRRVMMKTLLDSTQVNQADAARIARQALSMSSDYEKAELLISLARRQRLDEPVQDAMVEAARGMSSDYERRRVLSAALARRELSVRATENLLRAAAEMSSDFEKAELLIAFSRGRELSQANQEGFLAATSSMSSDYEHRRVLSTLVARQDASPAIAEPVCSQSTELSSDYERAELLVQLARKFGTNSGARTCIRRSAEGMSSDYERDRVLAVLGRMAQ